MGTKYRRINEKQKYQYLQPMWTIGADDTLRHLLDRIPLEQFILHTFSVKRTTILHNFIGMNLCMNMLMLMTLAIHTELLMENFLRNMPMED
jgi:hypothetical protein